MNHQSRYIATKLPFSLEKKQLQEIQILLKITVLFLLRTLSSGEEKTTLVDHGPFILGLEAVLRQTASASLAGSAVCSTMGHCPG